MNKLWIEFLTMLKADTLTDIEAIRIKDEATEEYACTLESSVLRDAKVKIEKLYDIRVKAWNEWADTVAMREQERNMAI